MNDLLALSQVPRWSIVPLARDQNVADHTFRVVVIAMELADRLEVEFPKDAILYALYHDADESRTGDIPTPAKLVMALGAPHKYCPWLPASWLLTDEILTIVALADVIEAHSFIERWGRGDHATRVKEELRKVIYEKCPVQWHDRVFRVMDEISFDMGR